MKPRPKTETGEAVSQALDRVCDRVCSTCGFTDPLATAIAPRLFEKILAALADTGPGPAFFCHESVRQVLLDVYPLSAEELRAATTCAAFAAIRSELAKRGLLKNPPRDLLQVLVAEVVERREATHGTPAVHVEAFGEPVATELRERARIEAHKLLRVEESKTDDEGTP